MCEFIRNELIAPSALQRPYDPGTDQEERGPCQVPRRKALAAAFPCIEDLLHGGPVRLGEGEAALLQFLPGQFVEFVVRVHQNAVLTVVAPARCAMAF